ncbi:MAG: hypothetical protein NT133_11735 [Alphaproteobacteria bacterium]|nr:hypothetical protein [Alphaproteobacteria bacterium]
MPILPRLALLAAICLPPAGAVADTAMPAVNPATPPPQPLEGWVRESAHAWLRTDVANTALAWRRVNANQWARVAPDGG